MFNLDNFISDSVTKRPVNMFAADIEANKETLIKEIKDEKVYVISGAGFIDSSFIMAILRFVSKCSVQACPLTHQQTLGFTSTLSLDA